MKTVEVSVFDFVEKQLEGPSALSMWIESLGIDPYKRPLDFEIDRDRAVVRMRQ